MPLLERAMAQGSAAAAMQLSMAYMPSLGFSPLSGLSPGEPDRVVGASLMLYGMQLMRMHPTDQPKDLPTPEELRQVLSMQLGVTDAEMTEAQRSAIVAACRDCVEKCIVITHGTDTMVETAEAIAKGVSGKTVVLTGAMVPYAFGSSDGLFNLGSALSFVQALPPGVYIAMNGRSFTWDNVRKNRSEGVFERLRE